jgi:zinc finger CCCH domain-containing protein 13
VLRLISETDGYRRDRETREQPRSRVRESSRSRRDSSPSRKDRGDRDSVGERERYRDREDRGERPARGIDHYSPPRDKEFNEDARRWRDDGKREERLATKKERDRDGRERDRVHLDNDRDAPNEKSRDRERERWSTTDERDNRLKRPSARERRYADDGKDEQRDKERERDKEKEPAWMETYIPSDSHAGILGGQSADGELDSIQAWKKGMKEKEEKDKQVVVSEAKDILDPSQSVSHEQENQMDEIQLFKMLIKREAEKKEGDKQPSSVTSSGDTVTNESTVPVNSPRQFSPLANGEY